VVRDGQDANLIVNDAVDEAVREAPHEDPALPVAPECTEPGVPEEKPDGVLEFSEQRLG
jgi:hypothetical protein